MNGANLAALARSRGGKTLKRLNGTVCYVSNTSVKNYYHWMIMAFPMIHYYRSTGHTVDYVYINRKRLPDYVYESLERAGLSSSSIITDACSGTTNVMAIHDWRYAIRPDACQFFRNLWSSSLYFNPERSRRIYVGRGAALQGRHLKNDEQLRKALSDHSSITPVTMDGLSLAEQANIFYNADLIVAPQGAALSNLVFCRPETRVIEIQKNQITSTIAFLRWPTSREFF